MGGFGSGRWDRYDRKSTVEESLVVAVRDFGPRLRLGMAGTLTWTVGGEYRSSIGFIIRGDCERPVVDLRYRVGKGGELSEPVRMQTTPTQFGGRRWWFTCPLATKGWPCGRRTSKLYLPPGGQYFGCRNCYRLTYRSCQAAHQEERLFADLDRLAAWLERTEQRSA